MTDAVQLPGKIHRVLFTHAGSSNFIVHGFDQSGDKHYLANKIGAYSGQVYLEATGQMYFEIKADGDWTIAIETLGHNGVYGGGATGASDFVSDLFDPPARRATYAFWNDGDSNFIVHAECAGGTDFIVNEIGPWSGEAVVEFDSGPCAWEVQAEGNWGITKK